MYGRRPETTGVRQEYGGHYTNRKSGEKRDERMREQIAMWKEFITVYTTALAEAEKYGDVGGTEWNKHMIDFYQEKIDEAERQSA
jgi:hypothetical protein